MSEADLLARIDDVTTPTCAQCGRPLAGSVSDDYCGPECQQRWVAHQNDVQALTEYVEPIGGYYQDAARWRPDGAVGHESLRIPDWGVFAASIDVDTSEAVRALNEVWARMAHYFHHDMERQLIWGSGTPTAPYSLVSIFGRGHGQTESGRLDLSWLDHYVPGLDEVETPEEAAQRLFPSEPVRVPDGALLTRVEDSAGPQVHADPRRNRRR